MICKKLSSINAVNDKELYDYVDRIIDNMTEDQLMDLEQSIPIYYEDSEQRLNTY